MHFATRFVRSLRPSRRFWRTGRVDGARHYQAVESLEGRTFLSADGPPDIIVYPPTPPAPSNAIQLDEGFGDDGTTTIDGLGRMDGASAVEVQPDGKILVAGNARSTDTSRNNRGLVARFNADGSRDDSFGNHGVVIVELLDTAASIALQPDGKILVGGDFWTGFENAADSYVVRLNRDGSVDTSFGNQGASGVNLSHFWDQFVRLAVTGDGKIVGISIANFVSGADQGDFGVARFNPDGSLDTAFGGDGAVTTNFGHVNGHGIDIPSAIGFLPGGKTLVAGSTMDYAETGGTARDGGFAFACYNEDGSLDDSFGDGGVVATRFPGNNRGGWVTWGGGWVRDLYVLDDGQFLAAGNSSLGGLTIGRYDADGSIDTSYGHDGFGVLADAGGTPGRVARLPDGRFAVAALSPNAEGANVAMTIVDEEGSIVGAASSNATAAYRHLHAVAFDADGRLVAVGSTAPTEPPRLAWDHDVMEAWYDTVDAVVARFTVDYQAVAATRPGPPPTPPSVPPPVPPDAPLPKPVPLPEPVPVPPRVPVTPPPGPGSGPGPGAGSGDDVTIRWASGRRVVRAGKYYRFTLSLAPAAEVARSKSAGAASSKAAASAAASRLAACQAMVSGPNGFTATAERLKLKATHRGAVAVYRVAAPGGAFDAGDNGTYAVQLREVAAEATSHQTTGSVVAPPAEDTTLSTTLQSFFVACRTGGAATGVLKE